MAHTLRDWLLGQLVAMATVGALTGMGRVFFTSGGRVYHVGVFAGWKNGRRTIIHAPYSGQRVHRAPIWTNGWYAGTLG